MDLIKKPIVLGQNTGKAFEENGKEALIIIKMFTPDVLREAGSLNVLSEKELTFLSDVNAKLLKMGIHASITGRQIFYLRDLKDKLVERGML